MTLIAHENLEQGSPEWLSARCGLLTASEMHLIVTPTGKQADNPKSRAHFWNLMAQRISKYVEPQYISDDMIRGHEEEIRARIAYNDNFAPVAEVGFFTENKWGFPIGYSPDGVVNDDGLIEIKSRRQKYQIQTIIENDVPSEYMIQIQTGLLVTDRKWCDFITYHGGLPMAVIRVYPNHKIQTAIVSAATAFEASMEKAITDWSRIINDGSRRLVETERVVEQEMVI